MDYYYDILLNFQDNYYMFYEWEENDNIEFVKKIPIIRVDNKTLNDMIFNTIAVKKDYLKNILNKTKLKQNNTLKYAAIYSDGKNNVALEFNEKGVVVSKSSLFLDDEININEFMYSISLSKIDYEVIKKNKIIKETRQEIKVKKVLQTEIKSMYRNKNYSKLKYIYLEWFNKLIDDVDLMQKEMLNKLEENLTEKEYQIYEIIKLSYNNV